MYKHAELPGMHIDNCWVDLSELYMILTVHGSDHKNQNASNIINDYRRDRQAVRWAKSRMWLSCILSYLAHYLQHTEGVHQSIIIIINHNFITSPPEKC